MAVLRAAAFHSVAARSIALGDAVDWVPFKRRVERYYRCSSGSRLTVRKLDEGTLVELELFLVHRVVTVAVWSPLWLCAWERECVAKRVRSGSAKAVAMMLRRLARGKLPSCGGVAALGYDEPGRFYHFGVACRSTVGFEDHVSADHFYAESFQ